jgi:hypothetical protein
MSYVGLAFAGLIVLSACAIKVWLAVRGLGRELRRTRACLEPRQAALASEMGRLERSGSETSHPTAYDQMSTSQPLLNEDGHA